MNFINELNKLICAFLLMYSSSIGVGDAIASPATLKTIGTEIGSAKSDVTSYIKKARLGKLTRQPGSTLIDTFESKVNEILNKAMNKAGKQVKHSLHKLNNIKQMVDAGSKGNAINISQIIACVTGSTLITLSDGITTVKIKDLDVNLSKVLTVNPASRRTSVSSITNYFNLDVIENEKELYCITAPGGRQIICTGDHPFLTYENKWKQAKDIQSGDVLCIKPAINPINDETDLNDIDMRQIVLSEENLRQFLSKTTLMTSNKINIHIKALKECNLLPL